MHGSTGTPKSPEDTRRFSRHWRVSLRDNYHGLAVAMMFAVGSLIPWTAYLAIQLPGHFRAANWSITWVGFDSVLMIILALTAWAAWFERQVITDATPLSPLSRS